MSELPVYRVRRVPNGSIRVDGRLDEPAWDGVEPMSDFVRSDGSGPAARRTTVRICRDDRALYFAFECSDPDVWGDMTGRDDPIYEEEVVEAFIDPDSDLKEYYELNTSPLCTLFDSLVSNPTGSRADMTGNPGWNCEGWEAAVYVDGTLNDRDDVDRGWTVEWAIPFDSLPGAPNLPPRAGDTWRINLYRIDRTPTPEFSCWSPTLETPPNFHVPSRFGTIVFEG